MSADLFESELLSLGRLYAELADQLEKEFLGLQAGRIAPADGAAILAGRLGEADRRVARLADAWPAWRMRLSAEQRARVESLAAGLGEEARELEAKTRRNESLLQQLRESALANLRMIRAGSQYLHSVKAQRENRPRFIDARR
jgi:acyl-CoA reductase-like NAD-dependent aldehyde dehydrogenase